MIESLCHCGSARWMLAELSESATACNCIACRRYGGLWAYGYEGENITVTGETTLYIRGSSLSFNLCPKRGRVTRGPALQPNAEDRRRIAVNLRMTEPGPITHLPIDHFDGLDKWEELPRDDRCFKDMWF